MRKGEKLWWRAGACSDNLKVIQEVTVSKVLIDGSEAVGVEYLVGNSSEPEVIYVSEEVILSAGVFGSSKILMVHPHSLLLHCLHC
jgi:choline dehydrogenase-like flavoprotein